MKRIFTVVLFVSSVVLPFHGIAGERLVFERRVSSKIELEDKRNGGPSTREIAGFFPANCKVLTAVDFKAGRFICVQSSDGIVHVLVGGATGAAKSQWDVDFIFVDHLGREMSSIKVLGKNRADQVPQIRRTLRVTDTPGVTSTNVTEGMGFASYEVSQEWPEEAKAVKAKVLKKLESEKAWETEAVFYFSKQVWLGKAE